VARASVLQAQGVAPFWIVGAPPPFGPVGQPPAQPNGPLPSTPDAPVAELRQAATEALVVSLVPLLPLFNRAKLKANLGQLASPQNGFKLTRLTGSPGVGKSYSYELIKKAAGEIGVTSAYVNLQGKSLAQACELIARAMKLDDEDMMEKVLRDGPDVGPLARKFVRWLSKATQSIPGRRWWLMLDSLDKESVLTEVREILINKLLEAVELGELSSVHLILAGHDGPLEGQLHLLAQSESLAGISRADIEAFLTEWARRRGRQLRPEELRSMVDEIVGRRTAPYGAADLEAIRETTASILEEVLT
jgi:hypothetical protein